MAIALDATASVDSTGNATWNHTVAAGSNLCLVVAIMIWRNGGTAAVPTTVTYNGVAMTLVASSSVNAETSSLCCWYVLVNPSTGTNAVAMTGVTSTKTKCASYSFSGVDQTTPIDQHTTNSGTSGSGITNSLTLSAANEYMLDVVVHASANTPSSSTGTTVLSSASSGYFGGSQYKLQTSSGSQALAWTFPDTDPWGLSTIALLAAGGSTAPTVTTSAASSVLSTTAQGNGNVTSDGGATVTERGFVWSTSSNPTTSDSKVTAAGTTGSYNASMTGLAAGTLYHYRAYAINSVGTSYGADTTFTTLAAPSVTTNAASSILTTSATGNGNVTSDGGDAITERGFVWSTSSNPTTSDSKVTAAGTTGSYTGNLSSLSPNTLYHYRAYAINSTGTSYGADTQFTTASLSAPSVSTDAVGTPTTTTCAVSGTVSSDGGATVTERGFVVGTSVNPTTANTKFIVAGTTGAMNTTLTGLILNTTYHVRAYAVNSQGTSYGGDLSFVTAANITVSNLIEKSFMYRVYSAAGVPITTWSKEVFSEPSFTNAMNSSPSELAIQISRKFDDFGESVDITLANIVELWVSDKEDINGRLIFSGYISGYKPVISENNEYIEVTIFPYASQLANILLRTVAGVTTIAYTNQDPANMLKDVIDKYRALGGRLNYSATSIALTNTVVSYTFNTNTIKECFDTIITLCPVGWYYRIDPDGFVYLQPKNTAGDHMFTIGTNIKNLETYRRIEDLVNRVLFTGGGTPALYVMYENTASQAAYGLYEERMSDTRVNSAAIASVIANRELNNKKDPEIRSTMTIVDSNGPDSKGYDIESVKVGQTLSIKNLKNSTSPSLWDVAQWDVDVWDQNLASAAADVIQILSITYHPDSIEIEASSRLPQIAKRIEEINKNLLGLQTVNNPVSPS